MFFVSATLSGLATAVCKAADPNLEPGFPTPAAPSSGAYQGGPVINPLVGNIDADASLEILYSGFATGPLYAVNSDGTMVPGWPGITQHFAAYPTLAQLNSSPGYEVVVGYYNGDLSSGTLYTDVIAYSGSGAILPGWGTKKATYIESPAATWDVTGDGVDEIFIDGEDNALHGYDSLGRDLPGWPAPAIYDDCGQARRTPAIADLDSDGVPELISTSGHGGNEFCVVALHADGTPVTGFPFRVSGFTPGQTFPAVGDVDGDGELEIVVITNSLERKYSDPAQALIVSHEGLLERVIALSSQHNSPAPALADMDGDRVPEIVVQTRLSLDVVSGATGLSLPGWPFSISASRSSGAVVGDVDGDLQPDVVLAEAEPSLLQNLYAIDRFGRTLPGFPKPHERLGDSGVPAIADIDLDERNEIVYFGVPNSAVDALWVYDMGNGPHGAIHWGQFMHDERRTGLYRYPQPAGWPNADLALSSTTSSWGLVAGTSQTYLLALSNLGTNSVAAASVTIFPATGADITGATADGVACDLYLGHATCLVRNIAGSSSKTVSVTLLAPSAGSLALRANVIARANDNLPANNQFSVSGTVTPAPDPPPDSGGDESAGGSGGSGGALDWLVLLLFGCAVRTARATAVGRHYRAADPVAAGQ